jgi:hypothetical protein
MPATTFPAIWDRINSLVAGAPYNFTQSRDPFSFDQQPETALDLIFRVDADLAQTDGYLGYQQAELWHVSVWFARKHKANPQAAYRAAAVDITSLQATLVRDGGLYDYGVSELAGEVRLPSDDATYLVGRITALVDIERAL